MNDEADCVCTKIVGHLEAVKWLLWPRFYKPSPGYLALGDWTKHPHVWLHYVESANGLLPGDDVLLSTDTRYWSIHDVQRYFLMEMHCEQVLFTYQYPNLRMPTQLGSYFWRGNTALKLQTPLYLKEFHRSLEITLKKMEMDQSQMDRLIISDQSTRIQYLDYFKRKTFFRILLNIMSFQDKLQLVSFENLRCKRLEGVRLIQQLACFNADSLKYLFLWQFVLPNENPILINYSYITDEEKAKIAKLLEGLDVPEVKLTERCFDLIKQFHVKYDKQVEEEVMRETENNMDIYENPYKVDRQLIEENEGKLRELLAERKRVKKEFANCAITGADPKRPWRTHTNKEKLLRINSELKRHHEKASDMIAPMADGDIKELVKECQEETENSARVSMDRLRDTVDAAKRNLPNFQYRKIENATATAILPNAHDPVPSENVSSGQYIPRPDSRLCFLRSLGELRNLRILAIEYSHIADTTGGALIALLPVLKRPHFRLQLICREDQTPGRADAALGAGGHAIPDTAWRRVSIACPDLYLFMAFYRIRDYDNIRRFLTPSIPLREVHVQLGIDLKMKQRQDSDISCIFRHLAFQFASTIVTLSVHQWRFAFFSLYSVLELMPRLVRFFYIGRVKDEMDLHKLLELVACGVCNKLKHLKIQIQYEEPRREYWTKVVQNMSEEFTEIMDLYNINFCLSIYKS